MKLVGYSDCLSVAPGGEIKFMVSSCVDRYRADLIQLVHGDENARGPGFKALSVESELSGEYVGKYQNLRPGSYAEAFTLRRIHFSGGFTVHMWIWPTTPDKPQQSLISWVDEEDEAFSVCLVNGRLTVRSAGVPFGSLDGPVSARTWYSAVVAYDSSRSLLMMMLSSTSLTSPSFSQCKSLECKNSKLNGCSHVLIAAEHLCGESGRGIGNFYNGKIDSPSIYGRPLSESESAQLIVAMDTTFGGAIAQWDFSKGISTSRIFDVSGNGNHGSTRNQPTRAVVGHLWDAGEVVWENAPDQYGAIHFHDDDLDDAMWEPSLTWKVPAATPSAVYALHIRGEGEEDFIPFIVRPSPKGPTANIALLMPTFSYLAYANSRIAGRPEVAIRAAITGGPRLSKWPSLPQDRFVVTNRLNSLYDTHTDGSGCCYASWLRPLVTMRPKYLSEISGIRVPHQFNADLHLVDWLTEEGYKFDVLADENLHLEGHQLLDSYRVLITGTHPEYWSLQMIRACQKYLGHGGRIMHMGGNGMYWVTQLNPESGHSIEMRRVQPSAPHFFDPHPGELHFSTTGERGGLWRNRGIPTQTWLGTVMSGAGRTGQHFVRRPDSFIPQVAWIFQGVEKGELIGAHPNLYSGYGAAGGEVDRVNLKLDGTPSHVLILATSAPFDSTWIWDPVDSPNKPRADLALLVYPNEGAVFSVSSIAWSSCLSHNGYNNNVSYITRNVLSGLLKRKKILDVP